MGSATRATTMEPLAGVLHRYRDDLTAFESPCSPSDNVVVFIGGLTNGIGGVEYVPELVEALAPLGWNVAQIHLSTSYGGWALGSIVNDAEEIGACVKYFKEVRGKKRVILMGFSTGCQDIIAYAHHTPALPTVDAIILQAPVSDREYVEESMPDATVPLPDSPSIWVPSDISAAFGSDFRITKKRWISLNHKPDTDEIDCAASEDFFSSDLSDVRYRNVFAPIREGKIPLLLMMGSEDGTYPKKVKEAGLGVLLSKFKQGAGAVLSPLSGIIDGANHAPVGPARIKMISLVREFIEGL